MKTDYDYYVLGCRDAGIEPLSRWRFNILYAKYQRERHKSLDQRPDPASAKASKRVIGRWVWLSRMADLVRQGRDIAERVQREGGGDEPGAAGAGMREPRTPLDPVLVGCAARSLPTPETLKDQESWRI